MVETMETAREAVREMENLLSKAVVDLYLITRLCNIMLRIIGDEVHNSEVISVYFHLRRTVRRLQTQVRRQFLLLEGMKGKSRRELEGALEEDGPAGLKPLSPDGEWMRSILAL